MYLINIEKAAEKALMKFTGEKWHCAESVLYGLLTGAGFRNVDEYITSMSGFNGGVGGTKNMCGALSGGVAAAGYMLGRGGSAMRDMALCAETCGRFYKAFEAHFGTAMCGELTKDYEFVCPERRTYCRNMVEFSVRACGKEINETVEKNLGK